MRRFLVRFIRPESFVHTRSSAGFTITTSEFKFSVHTPGSDLLRTLQSHLPCILWIRLAGISFRKIAKRSEEYVMCRLFAHQPQRDYESQTRSLRIGGHCT